MSRGGRTGVQTPDLVMMQQEQKDDRSPHKFIVDEEDEDDIIPAKVTPNVMISKLVKDLENQIKVKIMIKLIRVDVE